MILNEKFKNRQPDTPIAYFDFDGTLTQSDTLMPFLQHYSGTQYYRKLLRVAPILLGYLAKIVPNDVAKERVLTEFLGQQSEQKVQQAACTFVAQSLPNRLLPVGRNILQQHQQQGHFCALVSASLELYLQDWAKQHGFDAIIGTQLDIQNGKLTGKLHGKNCFGAEKVQRIEQEIGSHCWQNSFAYSDSKTDMPMLESAEKGFLLQGNQFVRLT